MNPDGEVSFLRRLQMQFPEYTREKLKAKILAGAFRVNGETVYDPNRTVRESASCEEIKKKYVSRGGLKLEYALSIWNISAAGKVFLDAGASTGGFTDCLLQSGAKLVHSVDVGYNQLDYSLRTDDRVRVHERKNIMECSAFHPRPAAAVADLSFRSIVTAAEHILDLTMEKWGIVLIKPQFECRREGGAFDGVVRDVSVLKKTVAEVGSGLQHRGVAVSRLCRSPLQGRRGNIEFLAYITKEGGGNSGSGLEKLIEEALV
jgi:23S rRNA (cytidine1920-2'-O)/16S rRNA (cytidine1409-2'-O)-methyltransferase